MFAALLHHQVFDISTMMLAVSEWTNYDIRWPYDERHRALTDVLCSVEKARIVREIIRRST
jgi:oligoribonuclease (3'-5' exoribonuclease)